MISRRCRHARVDAVALALLFLGFEGASAGAAAASETTGTAVGTPATHRVAPASGSTPTPAVAPAAEASPAGAETTLPLRAANGGPPNVLLLTIDTLRMDHLGLYGYRLPTSPTIDRLASEGVVFTDAITPVPTTAPALASLLTGQHVEVHRVDQNVGTFPAEVGSLAEAFAAAGYDTAAFYGNEAIEDFGRGFRVFEEFGLASFARGMATSDQEGIRQGIEWLEQAREPWFLWLHFIDPHGPYDSSPPSRSAAFTYPDDPRFDRELEVSSRNWVFGALPRYQDIPGAGRVVDYVRRYDGEIRGTDLQIEKLRTRLEEKGLLDHTLLVLAADHGESLDEDDYFFQHGKVLNEASLRIPFFLRHTSLPAGTRVDAPLSLVDVYPTLASLVGLPAPKGIAGRDLSGAIFGEDPGERLRISYTVTPELLVSVSRGPWRLEGVPVKTKEGGVRVDRFRLLRLFDTRVRPERRVDQKDHRDVVRALRPELLAASKRIRNYRRAVVEPTREQQDRLRALGYID